MHKEDSLFHSERGFNSINMISTLTTYSWALNALGREVKPCRIRDLVSRITVARLA